MRSSLGAAAAVLFLAICYRVLDTPFWNVNGARLMPSFAVAHGVNYYVALSSGGPLYSTLYGPLVALLYLPATLFPSPNSAVLAGAVITVVLCFASVAFLHFAPSGTPRGAVDVLAFLTAGILICYLQPLNYSCFDIHADGPGLAFAAVACGAFYRPEKSRWAVPLSALCAVLSILCKQMFLPVPFALLAYLVVIGRRKPAVHYLVWLAVFGLVAGAAALAAYGPARLYHCLIWIPAHHPWNSRSRLESWVQSGRSLILLSMPVPVLLVLCAIYFGLREWRRLAAHRCVPLLLVGIALAPFSILGRAKTGGDINSLSFASFFLACGLTVMLADIWRHAQNPFSRRLAVSILVSVLALLAIFEAPLALAIPSKIRHLPRTEQAVAFRYLEKHPGEAYFPWFPLAHFYAEHKFRHYGFGIADRLLAGEPISMAEFRAYIPKDPRVIAFGKDGTPRMFGYNLMRYLPDYRYQVNDPELPGWLVFAKAPR